MNTWQIYSTIFFGMLAFLTGWGLALNHCKSEAYKYAWAWVTGVYVAVMVSCGWAALIIGLEHVH